MQRITFDGGGYVLHNITLKSSKCCFSAWYDKQGILLDCEKINKLGYSLNATNKQKLELSKLGEIHKWYDKPKTYFIIRDSSGLFCKNCGENIYKHTTITKVCPQKEFLQ